MEGSFAGDSSDDEREVQLLRPEQIEKAVREIRRSLSRSRKLRIKLLYNANLYFAQLAKSVAKGTDHHTDLMLALTELQNLIIETANLSVSLSHPPSHIDEIYDTLYNMGYYLENVIFGVYKRCASTGDLFGEHMKDFLNSLIKISCDNPESWLYSVLISPIVLQMMYAFSQPDHEEFRTSWCYEIGDMMFLVAKAIFNCGDFSCQHYLVTFFSYWARWANLGRVLPVINSVFRNVSGDARKELLRADNDAGASVRTFLNAFNTSPGGPKSIIPIPYLYLFVCDTEIRPPEHQVCATQDLWVDFSIVSGRLHAFYSVPGAAKVSLSIRRDQIDSVCLHWVVNDGRSQGADTQQETQESDTQSQSTFMKDEKVIFFHIVLSVDFESITNDIPGLNGKHYRSIYFVFRNGDLVEKVLRDMGYNIHECGTKNCERPRALRRLLASVHKLSYTETWCPESQILGLDKSLDGTNCSVTASQNLNESRRSLLNASNKENEESSQTVINTIGNVSRVSETSSAFNVSIQSVISREDDEYEDSVYDVLNVSNATNFEDPLPPTVRDKYARVDNHAPFHQKPPPGNKENCEECNQEDQTFESATRSPENALRKVNFTMNNLLLTPSRRPRKFKYIRNSSPKVYAPFPEPTTPPVSEIGSPQHRILNLTIGITNSDSDLDEASDENQDVTCDSVTLDLDATGSMKKSNLAKPDEITLEDIKSNEGSCGEMFENKASADNTLNGGPDDEMFENITAPDNKLNDDKGSYGEMLENNAALDNTLNGGSDDEMLENNTVADNTFNGGSDDEMLESVTVADNKSNNGDKGSDVEILENNSAAADNTLNGERDDEMLENNDAPDNTLNGERDDEMLENNDAPDNTLNGGSDDEIFENSPPGDNALNGGSGEERLENNVAADNTLNGDDEMLEDIAAPDNTLNGVSDDEIFENTPPGGNEVEMLENNATPDYTLNGDSDDDEMLENNAPHNVSLGSLSPVFGFSRTLVSVSSAPSKISSFGAKNSTFSFYKRGSKRKNDSGRTPCYSNAFQEATRKLLEKMKNEDYDPYDLWSSSEMDEFRDKLFPKKKIKTYPVRKTVKGKKGKIVKMTKRNLQHVLGGWKTARVIDDDDVNTEEFAFKDTRPSKKYASFFRKRD